MPLQKLQFRPGVNREGTTLTNEGGWFQCDKIRFRSGQVEKIGGWSLDAGTVAVAGGQYVGVCRDLWNWIGLNGYNYLSIGTNQKFYVQLGVSGNLYDVTPIRAVISSPSASFAATNGSSVIVVTQAGHNAQTGDFVTFSGATSLGGNVTASVLNQAWGYQITYISSTQYSITVGVVANASDTGTGGGAVTATYQITSGGAIYTTGLGWGVGEWGGVSPGATTTTLNGALSNSATTITVVSTTGFPSAGTILIDSELITYSGVGGTTFTGCTRGTNGTAAVSHTSGTQVISASTYTGWGIAAPTAQGIGQQLRLWSTFNFGQNLLFNPRGGPIYYWVVDNNPNNVNIAQVLSSTNTNTQNGTQWWLTDSNCPTICNYMMVSDASRFVIAFGVNDYGSSTQNPMLIRWSDQESVATWTPTAINQAGSYTLSHGSYIVTALQSRQEILIWTDAALYSMQYLGAPYVWGFTLLADNISITSPNATATVNNVAYWMGQDKFYMYSGQVQTLPCTLRQYVFDNINLTQSYQFFAGTNEGFNEVWWFYCSANSTVIDSYVIYNHLEQIWYYGNLTRTAWLDSPLRTYPMAAGYAPVTTVSQAVGLTDTTIKVNSKSNFPAAGVVEIGSEKIIYSGSTSTTLTGCSRGAYGTTAATHKVGAEVIDIGVVNSGLIYHESQVDDGTANPPNAIAAYIQSSDFDIGDGHAFGFVWRIIPDVSFDGSVQSAGGSAYPSVNFTVLPRQNPGANYGSSDNPTVTSLQNYAGSSTYNVQQFTEYAYCRLRGRQMALIVSSDQVGTQWQLGSPRLDVRPDGRR